MACETPSTTKLILGLVLLISFLYLIINYYSAIKTSHLLAIFNLSATNSLLPCKDPDARENFKRAKTLLQGKHNTSLSEIDQIATMEIARYDCSYQDPVEPKIIFIIIISYVSLGSLRCLKGWTPNHVGLLHSLLQSCPERDLNSATASIPVQAALSESATVHCFSFVRALISLRLEVWNFLLIKAFIAWKDIDRSMHCKIVVPILASVSASPSPLMPIEFIADCESESFTALVNFVSRQHNWHSVILMASISPSKAVLLRPAAAEKEKNEVVEGSPFFQSDQQCCEGRLFFQSDQQCCEGRRASSLISSVAKSVPPSLISSVAKGVPLTVPQVPQVVQGRPAFFSVSQGVHRASRFLFSSSRCLERPAFFSVPQGV
ncbi:unnamed protein product [Rodentolepis nana]|uniref:Transmembrane protein n=1 Tax=Rodentolepis nana TaxID=102285 RepID=A0A0R3T898_RODNA|nr:unnamed protein product [Rodentolepis nana]